MAQYFAQIQQAHRIIHHIMTGMSKVIIIHPIVIGGMKLIILLPFSRAKKLTQGILCLIENRTVSLEMTQPQT